LRDLRGPTSVVPPEDRVAGGHRRRLSSLRLWPGQGRRCSPRAAGVPPRLARLR
jgi:hypothetical protein